MKILYHDDDILLVFKPHGIPSAPLKEGEENTCVSFAIEHFPSIKDIAGRKSIEYSLLHRIDTDTEGMLLFALNQKAYDFLLDAQKENLFRKYYKAYCCFNQKLKEGYPEKISLKENMIIESYFRPFGKGQKEVRPVAKDTTSTIILKKTNERLYRTRILSIKDNPSWKEIRCVITNGFRHQIRSHLSWGGCPIAGDKVYGREDYPYPLQLYATGIEFPHPKDGKTFSYDYDSSLKSDFLTSATR